MLSHRLLAQSQPCCSSVQKQMKQFGDQSSTATLVLYTTLLKGQQEGKRQRKVNYVPSIGQYNLQPILSSPKSFRTKIQIYCNSVIYGAWGTEPLKHQRSHCMISHWHAFGSLLSGHLGPVLLKSFDVYLPRVARLTLQFLLPVPVLYNSFPPDLAFSFSEFGLVSFHAPRKEVKEKQHSALSAKAWVHISSEQNSQLYFWRGTFWTSTGFAFQTGVIAASQVSFWKQQYPALKPCPVH